MLIILSIFFLIVWLIFFKFEWLPWSRGWKITVYTIAVAIALVVVGALQYYTPASVKGVVAAYTQQIYPLVSGDVEEVFVNESQPVKAGQKLFSIDPRPFQYAVDNWEATTLLAEIELNDAKLLVKKGAASRISVDKKQAQFDQARAQLETARYNLLNTVVTAPADGLIAITALRPGQRVSSQTAAMSFIDTSNIWITAIFKQNGLPLIEPGKPVTVTFKAAPGEVFSARVERELEGVIQGQITIEAANSPAQAVSNAQNIYPVKIQFPDDAPEELRQPGKIASVTVFTDEDNPINVLAKVLQWVSTWMAFVF
jgi:RND family efflux transporter MFP subunit